MGLQSYREFFCFKFVEWTPDLWSGFDRSQHDSVKCCMNLYYMLTYWTLFMSAAYQGSGLPQCRSSQEGWTALAQIRSPSWKHKCVPSRWLCCLLSKLPTFWICALSYFKRWELLANPLSAFLSKVVSSTYSMISLMNLDDQWISYSSSRPGINNFLAMQLSGWWRW